MNLRQSLKEDFGLEILVQSGNGLRNDPFVLERCSATDATRTQLNLLRGLGRGRGEMWRLLQAEPIAPAVQCLRINTALFTRNQIITETRAYYFDVSRVDGVPDASIPLVEWTNPRTTFCAVYQIGWLHFDRVVEANKIKHLLDTSLQYSSFGAKAAIYVYGSADRSLQELTPAESRAKELRTVCNQISAMQPNAEAPWPVHTNEPFALQAFLSGDEMTIAGIAVLGTHFLKLRLTFFDDMKMRELMGETVHELAQFVRTSRCGTPISDVQH